MATSYADRNAAAKAQGYKSLYDMRKQQMAAKAASTATSISFDPTEVWANTRGPLYGPAGEPLAGPASARNVFSKITSTQAATPAPIPTAIPGQLALPAAGQTSTAVNPALLDDVMARMGNPGAAGPTMGAIPQAAANPQLSAIASRSAGAQPATLMTIGDRTAQATQAATAPGRGTIMGALNPGQQPLALGPGTSNAAASGAAAASGVAPIAGEAASVAGAAAPWFSWGTGGRAVALGGAKGAMRASGLGFAGLTAGGMVDSMNLGGENSDLDRGASAALKGAGIGAAAGSVIPVLGTGVGAAIGGLIGGAYGLGKKPKNKVAEFDKELANQTNTLGQIAQAYGLDAATQQELMKSFMADAQVAKITGGKKPDKSLLAQQVAAYTSQIPAIQAQKAQMSQAGYDGMAMGRAIQSYIDPYMAKAAQTQQVSADYYQGLADKYASQPGIGSGYGAMAQNARNYGATSNADWAKAMSLQPTVAALASAQAQAAQPVARFQSVYTPVPALG